MVQKVEYHGQDYFDERATFKYGSFNISVNGEALKSRWNNKTYKPQYFFKDKRIDRIDHGYSCS